MVKHFNLLSVAVVFIVSVLFVSESSAQSRPTYTRRSAHTTEVGDAIMNGISSLFKKKEKKDKKKKDNSTNSSSNNEIGGDDVVFVVTGDGPTKDEATKVALRSAIEQTFGTFVSSNTKILNDELVKDEIVTVSSGNIKNFKTISENETNGRWYVTVQTTVSIGKLIAYAKSKGSEAELAGATFAMNMKLNQLNEKNQNIALKNLTKQLEAIFPTIFDYELKVSEPYRQRYNNKDRYGVTLSVLVKTNKNLEACYNLFHNTLSALPSFSLNEYKKQGLSYCRVRIGKTIKYDIRNQGKIITSRQYLLRGEYSNNFIHDIERSFFKNIAGFVINDGQKEYFGYLKDYRSVEGDMSIHLKDSMGEKIDDTHVYLSEYTRFSSPRYGELYYIYTVNYDEDPYDHYCEFPFLATPNYPCVQIAELKFHLDYSLDEISKISNFKITPIGLYKKNEKKETGKVKVPQQLLKIGFSAEVAQTIMSLNEKEFMEFINYHRQELHKNGTGLSDETLDIIIQEYRKAKNNQ